MLPAQRKPTISQFRTLWFIFKNCLPRRLNLMPQMTWGGKYEDRNDPNCSSRNGFQCYPLSLVSFTAAAAAAAPTILFLGGGWTVSDWQQIIMARDVAVLWKVIWILSEMSIIAENSLDNTHCRFCDNRDTMYKQQQHSSYRICHLLQIPKYTQEHWLKTQETGLER